MFRIGLRRAAFVCLSALLFTVLAAIPAGAFYGLTTRASLDTSELQATGGHSEAPAISATNGRWVAFSSSATNLVASDSNGVSDVFVRDTVSGATTRLSVTTDGTQSNGPSDQPTISLSGRHVFFRSQATNLAANDTGTADIYVRDRDTDSDSIFDEPGFVSTVRISLDTGGLTPNGASAAPSTYTGRFVAYQSDASDLVAGDTNGQTDIFVHDRDTDADGTFDEAAQTETVRISVSEDGVQGDGPSTDPSINSSGRYVAFTTLATTLLLDDINNDVSDVVVADRDSDADSIFDEAGATTIQCASVDSAGAQQPAGSDSPSISQDGSMIAFRSDSNLLVANDTNQWGDVFVRQRDVNGDGILSGLAADTSTTRASVDSLNAQANGPSEDPALAPNETHIAFRSAATNLVAGDTNSVRDVFVRSFSSSKTERSSVADVNATTQANRKSYAPAISSHGSHVAFASDATNLVASDTNALRDVFVRQRDVTAPSLPVATSSSHTAGSGTWSGDPTIAMSWTTPTDDISGLDGYSWSWNTSPTTVPDATKDGEEGTTSAVSPSIEGLTVYFHIRTVDNAGNWSATAEHAGPYKIDASGPVATIGTLAAVKMSSFSVTWSATDSGVGSIQGYEVRYRKRTYNGSFGSYVTWVSAWSSSTSKTMSPTSTDYNNATVYCFAVRSRDTLAKTGSWSADKCTSLPRDDAYFVPQTSGWSAGSSSSYYRSTYVKSTTYQSKIRAMIIPGASVVSIVGTKCSTCGSIAVYVNNYYRGTFNMYAASTLYKQVFTLPVGPPYYYSIDIVALTTGGKKVVIDGVAVK
jgi:Tol biopolymer transport system component